MIIDKQETNPESVGIWVYGTVNGSSGSGNFTLTLDGDLRDRIAVFLSLTGTSIFGYNTTRAMYAVSYNSTTNITTISGTCAPLTFEEDVFTPQFNQSNMNVFYAIFISKKENSLERNTSASIQINLKGVMK
jgi:hypothetical protein